jgi:hypothetical protein
MQQPCQHCGFESPASDKYCRQCGASLPFETEFSAAATRNYGRQEPAPPVSTAPSAHSGRFSPSVADAIAGETERYYQEPQWSPAPPAPNTAPIQTRLRSRRWFLLFFLLFIGIVVGAFVTGKNVGRERAQQMIVDFSPEDEARQRQEELKRELEDRMREAQDHAREAMDRQREALDHAREAAEQAAEAGAAAASPGVKLLDLTPYEYPGATIGNSIRIPGHETLTLRTSDDFEQVLQYYQKKLGKPVIQINESWEKRLLFQSTGAPPISVSVETDYERGGQLKIVVLRSPFGTIRPDDALIR